LLEVRKKAGLKCFVWGKAQQSAALKNKILFPHTKIDKDFSC